MRINPRTVNLHEAGGGPSKKIRIDNSLVAAAGREELERINSFLSINHTTTKHLASDPLHFLLNCIERRRRRRQSVILQPAHNVANSQSVLSVRLPACLSVYSFIILRLTSMAGHRTFAEEISAFEIFMFLYPTTHAWMGAVCTRPALSQIFSLMIRWSANAIVVRRATDIEFPKLWKGRSGRSSTRRADQQQQQQQ